MARIRNRATGVVVSTSDEIAADLSRSDWEPAEKAAPKKTAGKSEK